MKIILNWQNIIRIVLFISLFCISYPALACKPLIYPVSYYVEGKIAYQVIFLGKVTSVEEEKYEDGAVKQRIEFTTTKWFSGVNKTKFNVRGIIGSMPGTDCAGVLDFSVKVGEEWLIFGYTYEGIVYPDKFNSIKVIDGKIPPAILKQIENIKPNLTKPNNPFE